MGVRYDTDSYFSRAMRYHNKQPKTYPRPTHGRPYRCEHSVYSRGTLYSRDGIGLVVIQQRYEPASKHTWWNAIDPWLVEPIFENAGFEAFFKSNAAEPIDGLYPTFTVRQVMWALRMKPIEKQPWETVFDHKPI